MGDTLNKENISYMQDTVSVNISCSMMFPIGTTISILKLIDYKNIENFRFEEDQCV